MRKARLGRKGPIITIDEYQRKGIHKRSGSKYIPYCRACGERVFPHALASLNVEASFHHHPSPAGTSEMNICPLSSKASKRYSVLDCSEKDERSGRELRKQFVKDGYVKKAYYFMLKSCGRGCLPYATFEDTLRNANRKNVWNYVGMKAWMMPYILLFVGDFVASNEEKPYKFHFLFSHKGEFSMDKMLKNSTGYKIERVFSNSGISFNKKECFSYPMEVAKQTFDEKTSNLEWMNFDSSRFHKLILPQE
ncbi:hypothetical protein [Halodesulfovibrio aestuarii]|uniref:Uncharacterized protein n=1 Tax=Halodesulfovibrio aestuarii TaxID=126333 RepID=A0A8G2F8X5_9BACT|nr:hypothetical protein [Halodesulfovibrio aestuarii]SHJ06702.1 hypothetical protein SAMN05660830_01536 [Halodesulfovibrio aestuarii]